MKLRWTTEAIACSVFTLTFFASGAALPMSGTPLPECDPSSIALDTIVLVTDVGGLLSVDEEEVEVEWIVISVGMTNGDTVLVLDPESVRFNDTSTAPVDTLAPTRLFDHLALESVRLAVDSGAIQTSGNPTSPAEIRVYTPTCVYRLGSGGTTSYTNVSDCTQGIRTVRYAHPEGTYSGAIYATAGESSCSVGLATITGSGGLQ